MHEIEITRRKPLRRLALVALGWALLLVGVIGLLLPVVPGGLLIVLGALVLDVQCPSLRRVLERWRARFPILERASLVGSRLNAEVTTGRLRTVVRAILSADFGVFMSGAVGEKIQQKTQHNADRIGRLKHCFGTSLDK